MERKVGLCMPIDSLPNRFGIGDFGDSSYEFVDLLKEIGINYWQIGALNKRNTEIFPIDSIYISLDELTRLGLLGKVESFRQYEDELDRQQCIQYKEKYIRDAYSCFCQKRRTFHFLTKQFVVFKNQYVQHEIDDVFKLSQKEIDYYLFKQFISLHQYLKLKEYANQSGIELVVDYTNSLLSETDYSLNFVGLYDFYLIQQNQAELLADVPQVKYLLLEQDNIQKDAMCLINDTIYSRVIFTRDFDLLSEDWNKRKTLLWTSASESIGLRNWFIHKNDYEKENIRLHFKQKQLNNNDDLENLLELIIASNNEYVFIQFHDILKQEEISQCDTSTWRMIDYRLCEKDCLLLKLLIDRYR